MKFSLIFWFFSYFYIFHFFTHFFRMLEGTQLLITGLKSRFEINLKLFQQKCANRIVIVLHDFNERYEVKEKIQELIMTDINTIWSKIKKPEKFRDFTRITSSSSSSLRCRINSTSRINSNRKFRSWEKEFHKRILSIYSATFWKKKQCP